MPSRAPQPMPDEQTHPEPAAAINEAVEGQLDTNLLRQLGERIARKKELKAQLKQLEEEMRDLQEPCMNTLAAAGMENARIELEDGSRMTLHLHSQLWARPIVDEGGSPNRAAVVEALREEGMDDFLKEDFNVQQLSGFARECDRSGVEMPERLAAVLDLHTTVEVRGRSSR